MSTDLILIYELVLKDGDDGSDRRHRLRGR
jgi:hypothetical protein